MIGVIADDLTGAAELAGIGLRYGLRAEVVVREVCGTPDLLCIDTDSRSCKPGEAARRAAQAARELRQAGARWIYKKVDSVLRGNVLVEVSAIQKALGLQSTLLAPANPCFGRVIRRGRYFVKGKPIHQTDFARDPEYPRTSSDVLDMLEAKKTDEVTLCRTRAPLPKIGIVVGEVSSSADVQNWAARRPAEMLPAGGAEFFEAMLNEIEFRSKSGSRASRSKAIRVKKTVTNPRELFVCGSASDYTDQFVTEAQTGGTPVFSLIERNPNNLAPSASVIRRIALDANLALESSQRIILAIGRPLIERNVAARLTKCLVKIAVRIVRSGKVDEVYAEGGATAAELVRSLGWKTMDVLREVAPGVITLSLPERRSVTLTIKPGSYPGWPRLS